MKVKVRVNPRMSSREIQEIKDEINENGGYCPCRIVKNEDTKCMCKDFRDMIKNNETEVCHCGLYESYF